MRKERIPLKNFAYDIEMLELKRKKLHKVAQGETLALLAETYRLPIRDIVLENGLTEEIWVGQVLVLPNRKGNLYTAQAGDSKTLLCGSKENYECLNGERLYPTQKVWIK